MLTLSTPSRADTPNVRTIKSTSSLCPMCRRDIPAEVVERDGRVYMHKRCPEHGEFEVLINSDASWYFPSVGAGGASGGGGSCCGGTSCCGSDGVSLTRGVSGGDLGGHDGSLIEHASTCIALIEIVETCNLRCPTCYADSPHAPTREHRALAMEEVLSRLASVQSRKGKIDILQLSGGEPTLHPRFFDLLEHVLQDPQIGYILLNTNGVRLDAEPAFLSRLGEIRRRLKGFEVYLQYDGPQEAGQRDLRGGDLRAMRMRVIDGCDREGIPVTLAMTVSRLNLPHLGQTLRLALPRRAVRGVTLQTMFGSGRGGKEASVGVSVNGRSDRDGLSPDEPHRNDTHLNVADILHALIDQSEGLLSREDFTPLPCGDPNCHTVGYLLRRGDGPVGVSRLVDLASMRGFLRDRADFNLEDLARCGCENEPLGRSLHDLEIGPDSVLRLFIKPFMDAWTYDQHRIDRCCVHVVGEGGSLESFCRHYAMRGQ